MKNFLLIISTVLINFSTFPKGGFPDTEADYIVPTSTEFIKYSRFKVEIIDRFEGAQTQRISYIFPEFLIGEANRKIEFFRIPNTENSWTSPELNANCAVIGEDFTCNIYLNKNNGKPILNAESALRNLNNLSLTDEQRYGLKGVIKAFYSHEPAGFMTYDID
jgi:hypothetical protein